MSLDELITKLTELRDEEGVSGEALVLFAHQPRYPLQCDVSGPVLSNDNTEDLASQIEMAETMPDFGGYFEDEADLAAARVTLAEMRAEPPFVYLLEGSSRPWYKDKELSPYASKSLWDR